MPNFPMNTTGTGYQLTQATRAQFEAAKAKGVEMHRVAADQVQKMPVDCCEIKGEVQKGSEEDFRRATQGQRTVQIAPPGYRGFNAIG